MEKILVTNYYLKRRNNHMSKTNSKLQGKRKVLIVLNILELIAMHKIQKVSNIQLLK